MNLKQRVEQLGALDRLSSAGLPSPEDLSGADVHSFEVTREHHGASLFDMLDALSAQPPPDVTQF